MMAEALIFSSPKPGVQYKERRAAYVVIIVDGHVATVKFRQQHFLPGGGSLLGETPEETTVREVSEELARSVRLTRKLGEAVQYFYADADDQYYKMQAVFFAGEFEEEPFDHTGEHELAWLPVTEVKQSCFHSCHAWAVQKALVSEQRGYFKLAMLTLETERLTLRQWRESDFEPYSEICADPEVMRYLGGKPFTRLEAWRHMAFFVGHWELRGYGHWAVEERSSGKMVGRLGFLNPEGWPGFEIGWTLSRAAWGKGYATEGARRALHLAFTEMGHDHVISLIHPENRASIRVAERLGEKVEGETEVLGIPVLIYGISRETWEEQNR